MRKLLFDNRFALFLGTQVLVLFGSLFFPVELFEERIFPILFLLNIIAGVNLVSRKRHLFWLLVVLFITSFAFFGSSLVIRNSLGHDSARLGVQLVFQLLVAIELVRQIWRSEFINRQVIFGLMSGYISLGFLGFFMFTVIWLFHPGAFLNLLTDDLNPLVQLDGLMYFSFITLLAIGYGEIVPVIPIAQKAAILVGLVGQFYLVILMAIVVGKYLRGREEGEVDHIT